MKDVLNNYTRKFDYLSLPTQCLYILGSILILFMIWRWTFWIKVSKELYDTTAKIAQINREIPILRAQLSRIEYETRMSNPTGVVLNRDLKTILNDMVTYSNNLTLTEVRSSNVDEETKNLLGSDGIIIKFTGDYLSTLSYLQSIEKLPLEIFWDKLEYRVSNYPLGDVLLHIHVVDHG